MSKINRISRRTFLKILVWFSALLNSFEINGITRGEAAVQTTAYGRGAYGQGGYPGFRNYLPVIAEGEK